MSRLRVFGIFGATLLAAAFFFIGHDARRSNGTDSTNASLPTPAPTIAADAQDVAASAGASAARAPRRDQIEVCGGARVPRGVDGTPDPARYQAAIGLRAALRRALVALRAEGSDRSQAAAEVLAASVAIEGTGPLADRGPQALTDTLAGLATSTSDPAVYALAYGSCNPPPYRGVGLCQALSPRVWTQLDPDNAVPWIALAGEAVDLGEEAAADDAMRHAAQASRSDDGTAWVLPLVLAHVPRGDATVLAGFEMATAVIGVEAARAVPTYQTVNAYCAANRLVDEGRRGVCDGLANVMADRSGSLIAAAVGMRIGTRLGWPASRTDLLSGQLQAYSQSAEAVEMIRLWPQQSSYACGPAREHFERLSGLVRHNDADRLRAWIAASGKTPDDLIAIGHAHEAERSALHR